MVYAYVHMHSQGSSRGKIADLRTRPWERKCCHNRVTISWEHVLQQEHLGGAKTNTNPQRSSLCLIFIPTMRPRMLACSKCGSKVPSLRFRHSHISIERQVGQGQSHPPGLSCCFLQGSLHWTIPLCPSLPRVDWAPLSGDSGRLSTSAYLTALLSAAHSNEVGPGHDEARDLGRFETGVGHTRDLERQRHPTTSACNTGKQTRHAFLHACGMMSQRKIIVRTNHTPTAFRIKNPGAAKTIEPTLLDGIFQPRCSSAASLAKALEKLVGALSPQA